jgi:uncharacterized RmlC-like cupin family protein
MNQEIALGLTGTALLSALALPVPAAELPPGVVAIVPSQLTWKPGRVAGVENAALVGDSKAAGPYVERVRYPSNFRIEAHSHPEQRTYTILAGTWYIGYGEKFDESKLQPLPAGSFYVEPPGVPHFVASKEEPVVFQLSGVGPTGTHYVDPVHATKK